MAIITVSRQIGSLGDEIADDVAAQLGYAVVDKHSIHEMMANYANVFSEELDDISEELQPGFFNRIFRQQSVYVNLISSLIYRSASDDNVVIKGRGGQFLLGERPNVINTRIVAPLEVRVFRVQKMQKVEKVIVEELVKKHDNDRAAFIRYMFKKEVSNPDWYDIVFNSGKFEKRAIVKIMVDKAHDLDEQYPMSEEYRRRLKALSVRKLVEATLQKEMPNSNHIHVEVDNDGIVRVSGYIGTDAEKAKAEELSSAVPGVTSLVNEIHVAHFPVTTWP